MIQVFDKSRPFGVVMESDASGIETRGEDNTFFSPSVAERRGEKKENKRKLWLARSNGKYSRRES